MSARAQGKRPEGSGSGSGSASAFGAGPSANSNTGPSTAGPSTQQQPVASTRNIPLQTYNMNSLQPHIAPRRLVIKNLRPVNHAAAEEYYRKCWLMLDEALAEIFEHGQPVTSSMEKVYRGCEDVCRKGLGDTMEARLKTKCEAYLNSVGQEMKGEGITLLETVLKHWKVWNERLVMLRRIFAYLDRSHLIGKRGKVGINDMGIALFRQVVFPRSGQGLLGQGQGVGDNVIKGICELVDWDRRDDVRFDKDLLKEGIEMLRVLTVYHKAFERRFLRESHKFFVDLGEDRSAACGLKEYIGTCEQLLKSEAERCDLYNFDSTTKRLLREDAHQVLVERYSAKLLHSGSVAKLLDQHDVESIKALYDLLRLTSIQKKLKGPWEDYIKATGAAIVGDVARGDEMIVRLLELRRLLDIMIRDAFNKDEVFTYALREAFGAFINDKATTAVWKTGSSKVGEMIAKYIDMLLRGGLKTLPKTLLSDSKDRADAEMSGVASTADEDSELDRQLDSALELFRFIEGKDVFEAFYKKDLARRLLMNRSASQDAERNMLSKLKSECGSTFTHNLEQMFKDQELGKDEMASYKEWRAGTGRANKSKVDLSVNILSAAAWPTYPDAKVLLPQEVLSEIEQFDNYYKKKHTGRRLTWKHNLAHCVVHARFKRGSKELLVSAFQAVVLTLFNEVEGKGGPADGVLSYEQIAQATGMPGPELQRTLQSLACGKDRVLVKHPKGKEVNTTDTFTVNLAFTNPKFRVKINQIQLKETKEENQETHKRVAADRQFETQAAIVRIMKSRKKMTHAQLVAEVINQTKSRGAVDAADIKTNIEKLIEKDYLEREDGSYTYLA